MGISINTNVGALSASAATAAINKSMETSMERLSTGKRINTAADDAAGVAIASRLTAEIRGTNQAIRNAADAQAMIDTAEGAHAEIEFLLQRMRELAVQSANDTNNQSDRDNLQAEMNQLVSEIDRIANVTTWAGKSLINAANTFKFQIGVREAVSGQASAANQLSVTMNSMTSAALSVGAGNVAVGANGATLTEVGENVLQVGGTPVAGDKYNFKLNGVALEVELLAPASGSTDVRYGYKVAGADGVLGSQTVGTATGVTSFTKENVAGFVKAAIDTRASFNPGLTTSANADGSVTVTQASTIGGGYDKDGAATSTIALVAWTAPSADATATSATTGASTTYATTNSYEITPAFDVSNGDAVEVSLTVNGVSIVAADTVANMATAGYAKSTAGVANWLNDKLQAATNTKGFAFDVGYSTTEVYLKVTQTPANLISDESATPGQSSTALSISSQGNANSAITTIDNAISTVNTQRANLGAVSNRLDSTVRNMTNVVTNLQAGRGRIEDADFAAETTNLAKSQILQQASMAMLAQANASKQGVLSLLQR